MHLRKKLLSTYLAIALIPILFLSYLLFKNAKDALESSEFTRLEIIADLKVKTIESAFEGIKHDLLILEDSYIITMSLPVMIQFLNDQNNPACLKLRESLDKRLSRLLETGEYLDIMLVSPEGKIVYSLNKKQRELEIGKIVPFYSDKNSQEWKKGAWFSDIFQQNDAFKMLAITPEYGFDEHFNGFIVLGINMQPIYTLIQDTTGLGKTGETLIVKRVGKEALFLNTLRHDKKAALKRTIPFGSTVGIPALEAAQGRSGSGASIDYRGRRVLASWRQIPSLGWGLVAKIDAQESFAPIINLKNITIMFVILTAFLTIIIAFSIAKSISDPIHDLHKGTEIIGSGNLDYKVGTDVQDEIGQLSRAFDGMVIDLKKITASRDELNKEISERRKAQEALRENEEKNRLILNSAGEAIYGIDLEGNCTFCNPACLSLLGYKDPEDLLGKNMHWQIHHTRPDGTRFPIEQCRIFQAFRKQEGTYVDDEVLWRFDGTSFPAEYRSYPQIKDGIVIGAVVTFVDITERKKMEEELKKSRDELETRVEERTAELKNTQAKLVQSSKMATIGQLSGGIAHEINNPLTGVLNNVQLLKMELEANKEVKPEEFKELLTIVEESALRCKKITQSLLDLSHASKGVFQPLSLNTLIDKVLTIVSNEIRLNNIAIQQDLQPDLMNINGDPQLLEQVILNLLSNAKWAIAKRFGKEGGTITIKTQQEPEKKNVTLSISDNGIGISEENLSKLFTLFFSTKEVGEGTGLGLTMLYNIIKTHNGSITAESQVNVGTTFKISLPY